METERNPALKRDVKESVEVGVFSYKSCKKTLKVFIPYSKLTPDKV